MPIKSALFRARGNVRVQQQLTKVRNVRDLFVDAPLRQVEQARSRLLDEDVDLLILGDSSTLCWSLKDTDRTLLPELLGQRLGNVVTLSGPGFGAGIYSEALRILSSMDRRPRAMVLTLALRNGISTHVAAHPVVGYPRSLEAMAKVEGHGNRRVRYVGRGGAKHTDEQKSAYLALKVDSAWTGEYTLGDYRGQLLGQGLPPWPEELERLRFDYFHGEKLSLDNPGLPALSNLTRRVEEYGVPTVGLWVKPPMERGKVHFPDFETHVRSQLAVQQEFLSKGSSALPPLLDVDLEDDEFEDSQNATEHFSYGGRVKIADAIADALQSL